MKTFRFMVLINNQIPGIIIEQRALNITQATQAVNILHASFRTELEQCINQIHKFSGLKINYTVLYRYLFVFYSRNGCTWFVFNPVLS